MIHVFDRLIELGHDIHLHIIGGISDKEYGEKVMSAAHSREYISVEGRLPRNKLVKLVEEHRYGLHAKKFEHFGMAVAELVAGGAVPFVHNSGGQTEIVDEDPRLVYDDLDSAVQTIDNTLNNVDTYTIQSELSSKSEKFSKARFQQEIQTAVSNTLR